MQQIIKINLILFLLLSLSVSQDTSSTDFIGDINQSLQYSTLDEKIELSDIQMSDQNSQIKRFLNTKNQQQQQHIANDSIDQSNQYQENQLLKSNTNIHRDNELVLTERCIQDSDCDSKQICNSSGHCQRKAILPLSFAEILGSLVIMTILGFGQAAGVGGGTSITPILIALFLYDTKKSVAIVIVLVFSGSLGNIIQISRERTHEGVPVIDYRLILVTLPLLIVGTVYGVAINKLLPPLVVCILLVVLLSQQILKTYVRFKSMREKEIKLQQINSILHETNLQNEQQKIHSNVEDTKMIPLLNLTTVDQNEHQLQNSKDLQDLIKEEYELYPKNTIQQIFYVSMFVIVFSLLRGGSKFDSLLGIPPCGIVYQMMNLIIAITFFIWIKSIIKQYNEIDTKKEQLGYNFPHGKLTITAMKEYAKTGFLAGIIGGMLGIGGGIILIPRWLEYGISSTRTTACTLTIVCFTTFNSFFQLYLSGSYTIEEIVFFSILALLSSLICQAVKSYVKRTKRDSILILILSIFMALATTLLCGIIIYHAVQNFEDSTKFGKFC